jgi:hypothetical protein
VARMRKTVCCAALPRCRIDSGCRASTSAAYHDIRYEYQPCCFVGRQVKCKRRRVSGSVPQQQTRVPCRLAMGRCIPFYG